MGNGKRHLLNYGVKETVSAVGIATVRPYRCTVPKTQKEEVGVPSHVHVSEEQAPKISSVYTHIQTLALAFKVLRARMALPVFATRSRAERATSNVYTLISVMVLSYVFESRCKSNQEREQEQHDKRAPKK